MTESQRRHRLKVIFAFSLVCIFWGSTYLAIAVGVKYVPAELFVGVRFTIAGLAVLAWRALTGNRVAVGTRDFLRLALIGILLLCISNAILSWAEEVVPTGLASLIVALIPLWLMLIDSWVLRGDRISSSGYLGLVLGIVGVGVLLWPEIRSTGTLDHRELNACLWLLGATVSWATGSALSKRWRVAVDPITATGWQMAVAGALNLIIASAMGEPRHANWTWQSAAAIAYLIVFGSWVGYSAYIWLLSNAPVAKVGTYAYVNPVIAVFLGWLILGEKVDASILIGSAIVLSAVVIVTRSRIHRTPRVAESPRIPVCETASD